MNFPLKFKPSKTRAKALMGNDRGATLVEFALTAPFFLMIVFALIDVGRMLWIKNTLQFVVEQGARYVMVNPTMTSQALEAYAASQADGLLQGVTFQASPADIDALDGTTYRTVSASYDFDSVTPFIALHDIPFSAQTRVPVSPATQ